MCYYRMLTQFIVPCVIYLFLSNCTSSPNTFNNSEAQQRSINERLEGIQLGTLQYACDDCNFYVQEAVISKSADMNKDRAGGLRSQTGVRVYIFHDVSIDTALYMLLDSTIFAQNMDKTLKDSLMHSILAKKNDFSERDTIDEVGLYVFSSLSYAKRINSDAASPKAMLDSVEIVQKPDESLYSTNSLEAFIVHEKIVILHFYGENNTWTRR